MVILEKIKLLPRKLETCFYRYTDKDYSDISQVIGKRKTALSVCPEPSLGMNTKCGRLVTWGFTYTPDEYDRRVAGIELLAEPYYESWGDVENVTASCTHLGDRSAMVVSDLLRWGVASIQNDRTASNILLFDRVQLYFEHHFDMLIRGCWPCFRDGARPPVVYIDYGSIMLP